jgi:hypothetical protein
MLLSGEDRQAAISAALHNIKQNTFATTRFDTLL